MKARTKYYNFISKISTVFLNQSDFDKAVNKSLRLLCKKTDADRSYIFLFKENRKFMDNTHEYCINDVKSVKDELKDIETTDIKWWINELEHKKIINIPDINSLPNEALSIKSALKAQGIKSVLCFPFFINSHLAGFVGLDNIKSATTWDKLSITYLYIAAKIICKAIEKENANNKLIQTNSVLKATLESSGDAKIVLTNEGLILNYNEHFANIWDVKDEIKSKSGRKVLEKVKKTLLKPSPKEFEKLIENSANSIEDYGFLAYKKDGLILNIHSKPIYVDDTHIGRVWKCTDITKQKEYEKKLHLISKVYEKSNDAILITDENMHIVDVNNSFEKITGYCLEEIAGRNPSLLQSKWHDKEFYKNLWNQINCEGFFEGEIWDRRKNGEVYVSRTFISKIETDGKVTNYIAIARDITRKKEYEDKIKQLAFYDALTSLPNRAFFEQNLTSVLDESKRYDRKFGLLFLDLDNFKYVNDTFGHLIGDKLLQVVSNRLGDCVRKSDIVARIGGDEFTIIVKDIKDDMDLVRISKKIINHLLKPIYIDDQELYIGTSIGICIYPEDAKNVDELTMKADIAMYNSKNSGKNTYSFFCDDMNKNLQERYQKEQYMRESIVNGDFKLVYQPFMCDDSHTINAVEALIRWEHPELGLVMPSDFIHIAEENGLIIKLGEWVFQKVCEDFKEFRRNNIKKVAVNISVKQFSDIKFVNFIKTTIKKYKIDPSFLEFEITEDIFLNKTAVITKNLEDIKSLGISFAIDDFGTGYSSLNYLKEFKVDTIKIDKSFVDNMMNDEKDMAIINTILYLSKELGKNVVAEGVETKEQYDFFKAQNRCDIQGFHLSKPIELKALEQVVEQYNN